MRLFITGGSGLLGGNVAHYAAQSHSVYATFCQHAVQIANVVMVPLDLCDATAAKRQLDSIRPDVVVHCAGMTNVDACERDPAEAHRQNVEVAATVARAAARVGARLVYISTDYVFDGERSFYAENDEAKPISYYGQTKLQGEVLVREIAPDALIIRTNFYGWNVQPKRCFAESILALLSGGQPVRAFTDQYATPIFVNNLNEAILEAIELGLSGTYHIAGAERCSRYEFAAALARVFELDVNLIQPVATSAVPLVARRPRDCSLSTELVQGSLRTRVLGLVDGLAEMRRLRDEGYALALNKG